MKKVAIMTDTISGIPPKMAEELDIETIPLHIIMNGISYVETEVDKVQLHNHLRQRKDLPTTSSVTPIQCLQAYRELSQEAEAILYIAFNSWLGMSYQAAMQAKETARKELPNTTVEVVDSRTGHGAQLLCVLEAARAANQGKSLPETLNIVNELVPKLNLLYILDTLYYLGKGGRVGEANAWEDSTLGVKSILEMDASTEGIMKPLNRARTQRKAVEKLIEVVKEKNGNRKLHAVVSHSDVPEQAGELKQQLLSLFPIEEIYTTDVSLTTVIHDGPGAIRLGWYSEDLY